jgi:hypothetical protein
VTRLTLKQKLFHEARITRFKVEKTKMQEKLRIKERKWDSAYIERKDHSFTQRTEKTELSQYPLCNSMQIRKHAINTCQKKNDEKHETTHYYIIKVTLFIIKVYSSLQTFKPYKEKTLKLHNQQ